MSQTLCPFRRLSPLCPCRLPLLCDPCVSVVIFVFVFWSGSWLPCASGPNSHCGGIGVTMADGDHYRGMIEVQL